MNRYPHYPDKSDYTTNAPTYYDDLARKGELLKYLSKRVWEYDKELAKRIAAWDKNLEEFDEEVLNLLQKWMDDGTFDHIINEVLMKQKLDTVVFDSYVSVVKITNPLDITADVQRAVDALPRAGGTVFIPFGDWVMHGLVELRSNQSVRAAKGTILRKTLLSVSAYSFVVGKEYGTKGYGGGAKHITIEGITFVGHPQDTNTYYANGLAFNHAEDLLIKDCIFKDAIYAGHAIDLAGCNNVMIDNCDFIGHVRIPGSEFAEAIQIDSSALYSIGDWAGIDALPSKDITVTNCEFLPSFTPNGVLLSYAPNPIGNHGFTGGLYYENITFTNNLVVDCAPTNDNWRGWIHFYGLKNAKFLNNTFKNTRGIFANVLSFINSSGGRFDQGTTIAGTGIPMPCRDIDVIGNHFEGFTAPETETLVRAYGTNYNGVYYPVSNLTIHDNKFYRCGTVNQTLNSGATLIQVYRAKEVSIVNNESYLGNAFASVWDAEDVTISENRAEKMAGSTVIVSNVFNAIVSNNRTRDSRRQLEIQEVVNVTVTGNTSTDTIQENASKFANKFRNLQNANVAHNVVHAANSSMDYGYYFYQTDAKVSKNVNNHANIADGFAVRPSNQSGTITNYIEL